MKFLKSLSVFAVAIASVFVLTGCNSGTLVDNVTDEMKQSFDTAITDLMAKTTDYKMVASLSYDFTSEEYDSTVRMYSEITLTGSDEDLMAKARINESGRYYNDYGENSMSCNAEFYMDTTESGYALYETRSETQTTTASIGTAFSLMSISNTIGNMINVDLENFYGTGEGYYTADEYTVYSLSEGSYRINIDVTEGSLESTSTSYTKININLYITDGQVVQIVTTTDARTRHDTDESWELRKISGTFNFYYDNIDINIPDTSDYTAVDIDDFPDSEIF